jgi:hypothetical protein
LLRAQISSRVRRDAVVKNFTAASFQDMQLSSRSCVLQAAHGMKRFLLFSLVNLTAAALLAQSGYRINSDSTAVPFLRMAPDGRAGGMGDGGVACASDPHAVHWNLANLAFAKKKFAVAGSYTPWMRALVPDINHAYLALYVKPDSVSAIGASVRYFSLGRVNLTSPIDGGGAYRPFECAVDVGYTRRLTEHFAAGITMRFIRSNLTGPHPTFTSFDIIKGTAYAGDITAAWKGDALGNERRNMVPSLGVCISNLGTKMWYRDRDSAEFLPANARFGGGMLFVIAPYHQITFHGEANKLIVPTTTTANTLHAKLAQITLSTGIEYVYRQNFKFRSGYFHEFKSHGDNRYITTGAGVAYNVFQFDFAYLIPVGPVGNPLEETVRFTLLFSFDAPRQTSPK